MARKSSKDIRIEELEEKLRRSTDLCGEVMCDRDRLENELRDLREQMQSQISNIEMEKQLLEVLAENNQLRETVELLKSQLRIYETIQPEEKKRNPRNAGRKKGDEKWVASYNAFCESYESQKTISETMKETGISRATYFRYKKLYEDTKINV